MEQAAVEQQQQDDVLVEDEAATTLADHREVLDAKGKQHVKHNPLPPVWFSQTPDRTWQSHLIPFVIPSDERLQVCVLRIHLVGGKSKLWTYQEERPGRYKHDDRGGAGVELQLCGAEKRLYDKSLMAPNSNNVPL